jgi:hypothetical protein
MFSSNAGKYHRRDSALSVAWRRSKRVASGNTPKVTPGATLTDG